MCMYYFFALVNSIQFVVSTDQKQIEVKGSNEVLTQENYRNSGTYTTYTYAIIKEGINGLGDGCFEGSSNLVEIKLSTTVQTIGSSCFKDCYALKSLTVPEGVEKILINTFYDCNSLTNLTLPSTLNYIAGDYTFVGAQSLQSFIIAKQSIFSTDSKGTIIVENGNIAAVGAGGNPEIVIPSYIETIRSYFLNTCPLVTSITFEEGSRLKTIEDVAFRGTSITSMVIPNGTLTLKDSILSNSKITKLTIPNSVVEVSSEVFRGIQLKELIIEDGCKGFYKTETGVVLNGNQSALLFLPQGTKSYNISSKTTSLNYDMIRYQSLMNISVESGNLEFSDFDNVLYSANKSILYANSGGNRIVKVHKLCETIYVSAFQDTLVESVEFFGNSVKSINAQAFLYTGKLITLSLPDSVTTINSWCFKSSAIKNLGIPSSLKILGHNPFSYANSLLSLDFSRCAQLKSFPAQAFASCKKLMSLVLPPNLFDISEKLLESCSSLESLTIPKSVVTIGKSAFYLSGLRRVTFENVSSVREIGNECFMETNLEAIEFPRSVWEIGFKALSNCASLKSVTFEENSELSSIREDILFGSHSVSIILLCSNVSFIAPGAFSQSDGLLSVEISSSNRWYCSRGGVVYNVSVTELVGCPGGITTVSIPTTVTRIAERAFYRCHLLTSITFEKNSRLQFIGSKTFEGCSGLEIVAFPSELNEIGSGAFANCENLHTVVFPSSLGKIGGGAFQGCIHLQNITFPAGNGVGEVGEDAFSGCVELEAVELPDSLKVVSSRAFYGCEKLQHVELPINIETIEQLAFGECPMLRFVSTCRTSDIPSGSPVAFSNCHELLRIIVSDTYVGNTFCGKPVLPMLDADCMVPSAVFTAGGPQFRLSVIMMSMQSSIIQRDED